MSDEVQWQCVRQRAGPLVKECRSIRPRLSPADTPTERKCKNEIIRSPHTAVCRSRADRLELRLAVFGFEGTHYTLTFDSEHLPPTFVDVKKYWNAYRERTKRWRKGSPFDYIYCMEGRHGDHRYHIHQILRDSQMSPAEVRYLWRGGDVEEEPVLLKTGGYRRLAEYFNKEATDGLIIPIGKKLWNCSRSLTQQIPPPERWEDTSGIIDIPDHVIWANRGNQQNDFGCYYYGNYILPKGQSWGGAFI